MSRTRILKHEINNRFSVMHIGTHQHRKSQQRVMHQIVDDLAKAKQLPPTLKAMESKHINLLIRQWRHRHNSDKTISNKLGVLRTVSQQWALDLTIPENNALAINANQPSKIKEIPTIDILDQIHDQVIKSILAFQYYFGLTKRESITIDLSMSLKGYFIQLPRTITHNHKARSIPVVAVEQKNLIQSRQALANLKSKQQRQYANTLTNAYLNSLNIDPKTPFRRHYAHWRWQALKQADHQITQGDAIKIIMAEMGLSRKAHVLAMLTDERICHE